MAKADTDSNWLDKLSEILTQPLPGTAAQQQEAPQPPLIHGADEDDDSLLDRLTEILSRPLPGTVAEAAGESEAQGEAHRQDPGEAALKEAVEAAPADADPFSATATAGADWMQREYERFNAYQEHNRQAFAERQRYEQERFFEYQKRQLEGLNRSQLREQELFRKHQQARFQAWREEMQRGAPPRPGMPPPPPPPPWWRGRR